MPGCASGTPIVLQQQSGSNKYRFAEASSIDVDSLFIGGVEVTSIGGSSTTSFSGLDDTPSSYAGEAGRVPVVNPGETALEFSTVSFGGGDVSGPGSSPDNAIVVFDGVGGKTIKSSNVSALAGSIYIPASVSASQFGFFPSGILILGPGADITMAFGDIKNVGKLHAIEVSAQSNQNDDVPLIRLVQDGTNPGECDVFVGDRNPETNIAGEDGDIYIRSDGANSTIYVYSGAGGGATTGWNDLNSSSADPTPPGTITMYGASTAPTGWLMCDGSAVASSTYTDLFNVIGTQFGAPGSGNFNLPNMAQRFPMGFDSGNNLVGDTSGASSVTLTTSEMPNHSHTMDSMTLHRAETVDVASLSTDLRIGAGDNSEGDSASYSSGDSEFPTMGAAGGGGAFDIVPRSVVVNYIIKT